MELENEKKDFIYNIQMYILLNMNICKMTVKCLLNLTDNIFVIVLDAFINKQLAFKYRRFIASFVLSRPHAKQNKHARSFNCTLPT